LTFLGHLFNAPIINALNNKQKHLKIRF